MSAPPIPCMWTGEAFQPLHNFRRKAEEHYGAGEVVSLVPHEDRSKASHDHFFVVVGEVFKSLPEHLTDTFRDQDHLRRWALIKAGIRDERTIVCASHAEALRVAAFIRPINPDAVVSVAGATVVELVAKSQSMKAMGKEAFQDSKDRVLEVLSDLVGVEAATLSRQSRAA